MIRYTDSALIEMTPKADVVGDKLQTIFRDRKPLLCADK